MADPLVIAGATFSSRLIAGTARFPNQQVMLDALEASGAEMVTASIRRISLEGYSGSLIDLPEHLDLFETGLARRLDYSFSGPQALPRLRYPLEEARIMFQLVVEPIIFRGKPHEDARGFSVSGDDDVLRRGQPQKAREIILHLRERHPTSPACRAPRASQPLRLS